MKWLEYGKVKGFCPHGFGLTTARGNKNVCGYCDPEGYEKEMKKQGRVRPKVSYKRVVEVL